MLMQYLTIVCVISTLLYIYAREGFPSLSGNALPETARIHSTPALSGDNALILSGNALPETVRTHSTPALSGNSTPIGHSATSSGPAYPHAKQPESFVFDPNTADSATWVRLGLQPWQARSVIRFRNKGGGFHRPDDVKRIYGLTVGQWQHLKPLIRIGKEYQYLSDNEDITSTHSVNSKNTYSNRDNQATFSNRDSKSTNATTDNQATYSNRDSKATNATTDNQAVHADKKAAYANTGDSSAVATPTPRIAKLRPGESIDLATADTLDLQRIPGIGPVLARRMYRYIQQLGGLASISQLNDDGLSFLPLGIEQYVRLSKPAIQHLHINKMTVRQLNNHPYITYPQALQIVKRVQAVGPFKSWNEILFLSEFTEADKARLEPYVVF